MMWQGSLGGGAGVGGRAPKTGRMMKAALIPTPGSAGAPVQEAMPVWRGAGARGIGVRGLGGGLVTTAGAAIRSRLAGPGPLPGGSQAGQASLRSPSGGRGQV